MHQQIEIRHGLDVQRPDVNASKAKIWQHNANQKQSSHLTFRNLFKACKTTFSKLVNIPGKFVEKFKAVT